MVPMLEALRREAEARGHRLTATSISVSHHRVDRVLARASGALRRGYLPQHSWATAGRSGRTTRSEVEKRRPDAVVGIAASGVLARARLDVPCVQITDATFRAIQGLYPQFTDLSAFARWQGDAIERAALRRSDQMVVASDWARRSLVEDYGAEPERITVAPFGPAVGNPDGMPRRTSEDGVLRVLAVATDWHRKGGDGPSRSSDGSGTPVCRRCSPSSVTLPERRCPRGCELRGVCPGPRWPRSTRGTTSCWS
ncbi:hypothetical protein A5N15_00800 [Rothia kristinae]|uniref:Glycosyltransferase subfamily 4-like N-terminal domain-containing protein n=1 Tax=Rothia kristinae TaxID=37923 RepID=A0A657IW35_9MICC|nr:hypothetical protein A5N15_00800 [Rothia kristinae]